MKYETFFIWVLSWQVSIRSVEPLGNSLKNLLYERLLRTIWYKNISLSICTLHNTNVQNDLNNILHKTSNGLYVSADLPLNFSNKRCFSFNLYSWHTKNFFPCACWRNFIIHQKSFYLHNWEWKFFSRFDSYFYQKLLYCIPRNIFQIVLSIMIFI